MRSRSGRQHRRRHRHDVPWIQRWHWIQQPSRAGRASDGEPTTYTVGVLVQANYGSRRHLRIAGVPVGNIITSLRQASGEEDEAVSFAGGKVPRKDGSIIVIVATDAPLLPVQLQRLAKRATIGLSKVGSYGSNTSGDIFLAFSTGNKIPIEQLADSSNQPLARVVQMSDNASIDAVFEAAADATEEAIYNALFMAESLTGFRGRRVEALDLDLVKEIMQQYS